MSSKTEKEKDNIQNVAIIGAGFMGWQIALQSVANSNCNVWVTDIDLTMLEKASNCCHNVINMKISSGSITNEQSNDIFSRLHFHNDLKKCVIKADLVIEAITESIELKRELFEKLDQYCPKHTILASNSSSLWIDSFAFVRKEQVLNMHFYPMVWEKPLVELGGNFTSEETLQKVRFFAQTIGLTPLNVRKESIGFFFNRVWRAVKKECLAIVEEGVGTVEDVDRAWMISLKNPVGPFGIMDMVGLDIVRDIEMIYYQKSGNPDDAPPQFLLEKIAKGELGQKTGQGFYHYPSPSYREQNFLRGEDI